MYETLEEASRRGFPGAANPYDERVAF